MHGFNTYWKSLALGNFSLMYPIGVFMARLWCGRSPLPYNGHSPEFLPDVRPAAHATIREPTAFDFRRRGAQIVLAVLLGFPACGAAQAGDGFAWAWGGAYAGAFAGSGRMDSRLTDVDGFSNWGNPGAQTDYEDAGFVAGAVAGKEFAAAGMPLRIEVGGIFGDLHAATNQLDPGGLDETAVSGFRWIATARIGLWKAFDRATLFVTGGVAVARIADAVTDIDYSQAVPDGAVDPDDSFRNRSTEVGWVLGAGVEAPLADAWMLRFEALHLDFGENDYRVNHSGNNTCGRGGPRRPCVHKIEHRLDLFRLAVIRRFGP